MCQRAHTRLTVAWSVVAVATLFVLTAPSPTAGRSTAADRIGFPKDYETKYKILRTVDLKDKRQVATVYANDSAASVVDVAKLPYPYGSVIVMEWRDAILDANGQPAIGADGRYQKGALEHIDVMRREKGYGEAYAASRAGEWEFVGYKPDGSYATTPDQGVTCAACHTKAGTARDFVFRGRFPEVPSQ